MKSPLSSFNRNNPSCGFFNAVSADKQQHVQVTTPCEVTYCFDLPQRKILPAEYPSLWSEWQTVFVVQCVYLLRLNMPPRRSVCQKKLWLADKESLCANLLVFPAHLRYIPPFLYSKPGAVCAPFHFSQEQQRSNGSKQNQKRGHHRPR
ncbi:hypothetical protein [Candidatus Electronema sp. JM]|uniref:hypothetical protein n=1 Tax=Candidatus Electronema sp. JM TaxID=3401571 RepID=UPI003AA9771F